MKKHFNIHFSNVESFTTKDIELLNEDLGVYALALKWGTIIGPLILVWYGLSWYFKWDKFLITIASVMCVIGYVAVLIQTNNIRKDIKHGKKITEQFQLERKMILGWEETNKSTSMDGMSHTQLAEFLVDDETLKRLIEYKKKKEANPLLENQMFDYRMLGYQSKFYVRNERTDETEF